MGFILASCVVVNKKQVSVPRYIGEVKLTDKLRRGTPVFITWDDSASYGGWRGDTHGITTGQVKSIGFIFGLNKEGIILTTSLAKVPPDMDLIAALDTLIIPHGCIRQIKVLELKGEPIPIQIEGVLVEEDSGILEKGEDTR